MKTRPTYTPSDLSPRELGPFTLRQRRTDVKRAVYRPEVHPLPAAFNAKALVLPTAVASIRKAFLLAKTSHKGWKTIQREGRFDIRQAPRVSRGAQDVFKRKVGHSTTRVKVSVLIDDSGSMNGAGSAAIGHPTAPGEKVVTTRKIAAAVFGATIAEALGRVPTVDLDVFQHAAGQGRMAIKWRWSKGTPVAVFNDAAYSRIGGGGNADGHALYAITTRMQREIKRDERGIILMVSDGLPSQYSADAITVGSERGAGQALIDAVAFARKAGIEVIAVAIDGSDQSAYYGPKGVVPFTGDWTALGSALAKHIGNALAAR